MAYPAELSDLLMGLKDMISDLLEKVLELDSPHEETAYECWMRLKAMRKRAVRISTVLMALGSDAPTDAGLQNREVASSGEHSCVDVPDTNGREIDSAVADVMDVTARQLWVRELAVRGDLELAEEEARRLTAEYPSDPNGHASLALVLSKREQYLESVSALRTAIELMGPNAADRDVAPLYMLLVRGLSELGDEAGARDAAMYVADLTPARASAAYTLIDLILRPCRRDIWVRSSSGLRRVRTIVETMSLTVEAIFRALDQLDEGGMTGTGARGRIRLDRVWRMWSVRTNSFGKQLEVLADLALDALNWE